LDEYLALEVWPQDEKIVAVSLQMALCDGETIKAGPWLRERTIHLPLGSERFFLPPFGEGDVDLWLEGYTKEALASKASPRLPKKHLRLRFPRRLRGEALPTVFLQEGPLLQTPLCQIPKPPITPTDPQAWLAKSESLSWPTLLPFWSQGLQGQKREEDGDRLRLDALLPSPRPLREIASDGRLLAGVFADRFQEDNQIGIFDLLGQRYLQSIPLPDGCNPRGMDLQGGILAVTCTGMHRLLLFSVASLRSTGTWKAIGPKDGIIVGLEPVDVRLSSGIAAVIHRGSHDVFFVRVESAEVLPKTLRVGEGPHSITAVNRTFFVANTLSNSISIFTLHPEGSITAEIPYKTGPKPSKVVANAWYLITSHPDDQTLTVYERQTGRLRSLYLAASPEDIALLSRLALVLDRKAARLLLVDLERAAILQEVRIPDENLPFHRLVIAGEAVWASHLDRDGLTRFVFPTRPGLRLWRVGSQPRQMALEGEHLWLVDPITSSLSQIDLTTGDHLREMPISGGAWLRSGRGWLLHTGEKPWQIVIRDLASPDTPAHQRDLPRPICGGEVIGSSLYLLHCSDRSQGDLRPASLTTIHLDALRSGQWDLKEALFPQDTQKPAGLVFWEGHLLLIDSHQRRLWWLREDSLQPIRSLDLPEIPQQILLLPNHEIALLFETGDLLLASAAGLLSSETLPKPLFLGILPGEMAWRLSEDGPSLWISDRRNDRLLRLRLSSRTVDARFRVGSDPIRLFFWKDHAILANFGSEDLSLLSLSP